MSWTYSGNPGANPSDAVRWEIGDTNEKTQFIQDEEILWALNVEGTPIKAAARLAEGLAARFAREEHVRTATFSNMRSNLMQHYLDLAKRLRARGTRRGSFVVPSLTLSGKAYNDADPDLNRTRSYLGIHKNTHATDSGKTDCGCENLACGHRTG